jgi:Effector Associated Constant Component 1
LFAILHLESSQCFAEGGIVDESSWSLWIDIGLVQDATPEEMAESTLGLQGELLELDVDAVMPPDAGPPPAGAKGLADGASGTLIVTLSDSAVLVALVGVLRSWVSRDRGRKITIRDGNDSIEVERAAEGEQARLIEAWLDRHAGD